MTDDAIKAALEAAARAMCFGPAGEDCDRCVDPSHCCQTRRDQFLPDAAEVVAAFLDALPPGVIRWGTDRAGYDPDDKPALRQFAAAVRRAGGGE